MTEQPQGQERSLLDAVVPPVMAPARVVAALALIVALAAGAFVGVDAGGFAPRLELGSTGDLSFGTGHDGRGGATFQVSIVSLGLTPVTLEGIGMAAPGLSGARSAVATVPGGRWRPFPVRLTRGRPVVLELTWRHVDCSAIRLRERLSFPVRYTDWIGLSGTVEVPGMAWARPGAPPSTPSAIEGVGWPAGVTWSGCHGLRTAMTPRPIA